MVSGVAENVRPAVLLAHHPLLSLDELVPANKSWNVVRQAVTFTPLI